MEEIRLFKSKFDDVKPGDMFINENKTKIYEIASMFSGYFTGWMLLTRYLDDDNGFTECSYIQTGKDKEKKMASLLYGLDRTYHLKNIDPKDWIGEKDNG